MYTIWNYAIVFFQMVLVPCVTVPENWKYCYKVNEWFIPELQNGIEIYFDPSSIYQQERDIINKER